MNRVERNLCLVGQIISRVRPDGSHEIPAIILLYQPICVLQALVGICAVIRQQGIVLRKPVRPPKLVRHHIIRGLPQLSGGAGLHLCAEKIGKGRKQQDISAVQRDDLWAFQLLHNRLDRDRGEYLPVQHIA